MNRQEDNKAVIDFINEKAKNKTEVTYEETVTFQLSVIAIILSDISKSLAIIADEKESEENDADSN